MNPIDSIGRLPIVLGGIIVLIGIVLIFVRRIPFLGRLPGDITIRTDHVSIFFPIVTTIIISIVLTIIFNIVFRIFR